MTQTGIAYRETLLMRHQGYRATIRIYLEGERTVFSSPGRGVDDQNVIFNSAGFRQRCEDSNMKLTWTRQLEADKHPAYGYW